jgi:hypothetical protein
MCIKNEQSSLESQSTALTCSLVARKIEVDTIASATTEEMP